LQRYPGRLIVVEGCDGSGKSTQLYLLKQWLEAEGYPVCYTEWNSSDLVKSATKRAKKQRALTPTTFSLIHACDFADRYERLILPHLQAGYLVLADRYIYTAFARDAVRGCDPDWVRGAYGFAVKPDLAFYFQAPLEVSLYRILSGRPELKYHEAGMDLGLSPDPVDSFKLFQGLVKEQYDRMAHPFGFVVIDATRPIPIQQTEVRTKVAQALTGYRMPGSSPAEGQEVSGS
jgi:dTMP kinase